MSSVVTIFWRIIWIDIPAILKHLSCCEEKEPIYALAAFVIIGSIILVLAALCVGKM